MHPELLSVVGGVSANGGYDVGSATEQVQRAESTGAAASHKSALLIERPATGDNHGLVAETLELREYVANFALRYQVERSKFAEHPYIVWTFFGASAAL